MAVRVDLTGKKFNMLTIIQELGGNKVLCKCDCGNEKVINKDNVKSGKVMSCGCLLRKKGRQRLDLQKNTVGQRFGNLVVLEELGGGRVLCQCDCGKSKNINKGHLLNGDITSCGCVQKLRPAKAKEPFLVNNTYIATIRSDKPSKRSTTGIKGVYWSKTKNKYQAAIRCQGINHELGYFNSLAEAVAARLEAEEKYFKPLIDDFNKNKGAD